MIHLTMPTVTKTVELINEYDPYGLYIWLEIHSDDKVVGYFQLQEITKITYNVHIHIDFPYQNKLYAHRALKPLLEWCRHYDIYKLICTIPKGNTRMRRLLSKTDFKLCGEIPEAIRYNNFLDTLYIYEIKVT